MSLNIIDPFQTPCETQVRKAAINLPSSPITSIFDAAKIIAYSGVNGALAHHIERELNWGVNFKSWRAQMPSQTPNVLSNYQRLYTGREIDYSLVNEAILQHGIILPHGQILFHGGHWQKFPGVMKTTRPFSATFCPQVAMREAEHNAKSYNSGYIDLIYIRLDDPQTKAFVYRQKGTRMGHEKEIIFATGATITVKNRMLMNHEYPASNWQMPDKLISSYLVEATLS